mgnify:FL=1
MSKNVTLIPWDNGIMLKSYDTFVAMRRCDGNHKVTAKHHSKTTTRQINEFFGGAEEAAKVEKVPQSDMDTFGKFIEEYSKLSKDEQIHYEYNTRKFINKLAPDFK